MYLEEKADFAGVLVGGIFYGMRTHAFIFIRADCPTYRSRDCRRSVPPVHGRIAH